MPEPTHDTYEDLWAPLNGLCTDLAAIDDRLVYLPIPTDRQFILGAAVLESVRRVYGVRSDGSLIRVVYLPRVGEGSFVRVGFDYGIQNVEGSNALLLACIPSERSETLKSAVIDLCRATKLRGGAWARDFKPTPR